MASQSRSKPLLIALEGIIASGKTTLMAQLQRHSNLKIKVIPEPIAVWKDVRQFDLLLNNTSMNPLNGHHIVNNDNNSNNNINNINNDNNIDSSQFDLLSQMYSDPERWSYSFQISALVTRAMSIEYELNKMSHTNEHADIIVLERSCHANKIFATVMKQYERLNDCEWLMYEMIFNYMTKKMPKLHGIIYLECDVDKAMNRLKTRNRNGEENVDPNYQISLRNAHNQWIDQLSQLITINNGHNNNQNSNNSNDNTYLNEFDSKLDVLRWPAKDFLENSNDLMDLNEALVTFYEKQHKQRN